MTVLMRFIQSRSHTTIKSMADLSNAPVAAIAADPFAGAALPALEPVLQLSAMILLISFIFRKGMELSFGK
jgi:hypothetical protein